MTGFIISNLTTLSVGTAQEISYSASSQYGGVTAPYTIVPDLYGYGTATRAAYTTTPTPTILHVTVRSGTGVGSFPWAIAETYPRIIVFDIGGNIDYGGQVTINDPYCAIYGQTAPSNVILNGGGIRILTHNVVIQHIADRHKAGYEDNDCVTIDNASANIVIDHCSMTWGGDEIISTVWVNGVTISNCIIGHGTGKSATAAHQLGSLNYGSNISHLGNYYVHNRMRSPQLAYDCENFAVVNSLAYNWGHSIVNSGSYVNGVHNITYIGNDSVAGFDDEGTTHSNALIYCKGETGSTTHIYMEDNRNREIAVSPDYAAIYAPNGYSIGTKILPLNCVPYAASLTKAAIIAGVGPRAVTRDSVDTALVDDVTNGTGHILLVHANEGASDPYPILPVQTETATTFVPVANPHDTASGQTVYTNLEMQLHSLAAALE